MKSPNMKNIILYWLALLLPILCTASSLPGHGLGRDKFVTDLAHILTVQEADSLKERLSAYEKETTAEIVVVIIPTLADYGYDNISQFTTDLGHEWKIGKKVAHNGIMLAISMKERKTDIRTGYGSEDGFGAIKADRALKKMKPFMRSGNYFAAISSVIDDATAAIANTDATNKPVIDAETAKQQKFKQDEISAAIADTFVFILFILAIFFVIAIVYAYFKKRKEFRINQYNAYVNSKQNITEMILRANLRLASAHHYIGTTNILLPEKAILDSVEGHTAMADITFSKFHSTTEKDSLIANRKRLMDKVATALTHIILFQESLAATAKARKEIMLVEQYTKANIQQYIEAKELEFKKALELIEKHPYVKSEIDEAKAKQELEIVHKQYGLWINKAKLIVANCDKIPFAIGAYLALTDQCHQHLKDIQVYMSHNAPATTLAIAKGEELQKAITTISKYTVSTIETMKKHLMSAANRSDVTDSSKKQAQKAVLQEIKHSDNVLMDYMAIMLLVNAIAAAHKKCDADVYAAQRERERIKEQLRLAKEAEDNKTKQAAVAAAILFSSNKSSTDDSSDNSGFGGGDVSGGGATGDW